MSKGIYQNRTVGRQWQNKIDITGCKIFTAAARDCSYSQSLELARNLKWINGISLV